MLAETPPRRSWLAGALDQGAVLVLLAGLASIGPTLAKSLLAPKYRAQVGDQLVGSPVATAAQRGFNLLLLVVCVAIFVSRLRALPVDRKGALMVMLAPWAYLVARDVYLGTQPKVATYLYAAVVLALWAVRPPIEKLYVVVVMIIIATVLSLALGVLIPAKGIFTNEAGLAIAPEKQILPWGILVGIFANGNALGQFLVLGLPAVAFVRRAWPRVLIVAMVGFSLVWTSSRSSLIAIVIVLLAFGLLAAVAPVGRKPIAIAILAATFLSALLLPYTAKSDAAFTNRGYIWKMSRQYWSEHPFIGLGSTWYNSIAEYVNSLPVTAFNGHNLFIHSLVTGGVLLLALMVVMFVMVMVRAVQWADRGVAYPVVFMASLLVSSTLEVSFGFVDRGVMLLVTIVPMAVIAFAPLPAQTAVRPAQLELGAGYSDQVRALLLRRQEDARAAEPVAAGRP